jgi:hypothetical protein
MFYLFYLITSYQAADSNSKHVPPRVLCTFSDTHGINVEKGHDLPAHDLLYHHDYRSIA